MKFKVGDKVRVRCDLERKTYGSVSAVNDMIKYRGKVVTIAYVDESDNSYKIAEEAPSWYWWSEEMLEPADSKTLRMADGTVIGEFNIGGTLPTREWSKLIFKNGSSIEALPQKDNTVRGENHFCNGFRGGKTPTPEKPVSIEEQLKDYSDSVREAAEYIAKITVHSYETIINKFNALGCTTFRVLPSDLDELMKKTEEKKMSTKFTFYVTEGTRIDKSCNKTVPTMTTEVIYRGNDGCAISGTATCDKTDYNERDGVLNAIANAVVGGNFDREFNKAVKANALADKKKRTCTYCGQVFDTVEEKQAHEAWHVERKKARRERYLLRKRAKEIAFEEAAQKLAKEMQNGDKK